MTTRDTLERLAKTFGDLADYRDAEAKRLNGIGLHSVGFSESMAGEAYRNCARHALAAAAEGEKD